MNKKNDNNTNIFQGAGLLTDCVKAWDKQLRLNEWVDTDVFADVFHFDTIHYEKVEAYRQEIKDAKIEIRKALAERGMSLREKKHPRDRRKVLTAYPEYNHDPLHDLRIMAVIKDAMMYLNAVRLTYAPSYHESEEHIFHPHYLRVYNGRQYVYGVYENEEENKGLPFVTLPIDRIMSAEKDKEITYRRGKPEDYEKLMRDVLGASPNFKNPEVTEVVLRTHNPKVHNLLLTKPLHHSIRETKPCTDDQAGELTLHVQQTQELQNWILHYGAGVEVVSPDNLRSRIAQVINTINSYYTE